MANSPLPEITCPRCNKVQTWTCQENCKSCGHRLPHWTVAAQLAAQPAPWNMRKPEFPK